jgi:hypothetical protein
LQWTDRHAEALRGAEVVVIADNDRMGMVHAGRVMTTLHGRARCASLLLLPGLERSGDVSDWLARGGDAAKLCRLADAAPRDPSPGAIAAMLDMPVEVDPLATSPEEVRALLAGAPPDRPPVAPHPAFHRTAAVFERLGVHLEPYPSLLYAGASGPHPTYRAVKAALCAADEDAARLLDDASRVERAVHELGQFAAVLRAWWADDPARAVVAEDGAWAAFITAPDVRLVRTAWDWDAFLSDPALAVPPEPEVAWAVRIPPAGPLRMRRLHPLPAMLLELCDRPQTRAQLVAAVTERVDGDPVRVEALVHAQVDELRASGILLATAAERADATVDEMRRLLLAAEVPPSGARTLVGLLARNLGATREAADDAVVAEDDPYPAHLLDIAVALLEQLLVRSRLRGVFSAELDGYWAGGDIHARVQSLRPLLDALARMLGSREHVLTPFVIAE